MLPRTFARTIVALVAGLALLGAADAHAASPASCGAGDKPETGLQGQIPQVDRASGRAADVQRVLRRFAGSGLGTWLFARVLHRSV